MSGNKKTFTSDKIRTSEIIGIEDSLSIQATTGNFDDLYVGGARYNSRERIGYAFRFGGEPIEIAKRLPVITGSSPQLFTGLASGQDYIFVQDTGTFATGDHIYINAGGTEQEEATITGIGYYNINDCCNAQLNVAYSAGASEVTHYNESNGGYNFETNDLIYIEGSDSTYKVTYSNTSTSQLKAIGLSPNLTDAAPLSGCICLAPAALRTQDNLTYDYPTGTWVANKYPTLIKTIQDNNDLGLGDYYWNNTKLLIQSEAANLSTSFSDSSMSNHSVSGSGGILHSTNIFKYGTSSIYADTSGDYLAVGNHSDFTLGENPFTIEFWTYLNSYSISGSPVISKGDEKTEGTASFDISIAGVNEGAPGSSGVHETGKIQIGQLTETNNVHFYSNEGLNTGEWYHIAVVREGLGADQMKLYINGVLDTFWTKTNAVQENAHPLIIGAKKAYGNVPATGTSGLDGFLEDIRITNGTARYTENSFVPPTGALPNYATPSNYLLNANRCPGDCYDTRYLYVEEGDDPSDFDWYLSGYRMHFIDVSGLKMNITGNNVSGLLELIYPGD